LVDPEKAATLAAWPEPQSLDDLVSFRAFCNFIKEFIPNFHDYDHHFRPYAKKGAKFADYQADAAAQKAFLDLRKAVATDAALFTIDYSLASDPKSGCPIELYIDASDYAWAVTVAQRPSPSKAPRPVAVYNRSFTTTEQAWSTFEREPSPIAKPWLSRTICIRGSQSSRSQTTRTTCSLARYWATSVLTRSCCDGRWTLKNMAVESLGYGLLEWTTFWVMRLRGPRWIAMSLPRWSCRQAL
jgi:hypothetical protein